MLYPLSYEGGPDDATQRQIRDRTGPSRPRSSA